ncbi:MAG: hypothetical protein ABDH59_02655 [Fervidobacterium sp.]
MRNLIRLVNFMLLFCFIWATLSCTQLKQEEVYKRAEESFPDSVNIDFSKDLNVTTHSTTLPEYDVSAVFSFTFPKPIQASSLASNVTLIREDDNSPEEVSIYLSTDRKKVYVKPVFRFARGNGEVLMKGLKPGLNYRIVFSPSLKFEDNSISGMEKIFRFKSKSLDYGIYWFSYDGRVEKFVSRRTNPYFDPSKPSVIYIHGWQKDTTIKDYFRENPYFLITKTIKNVNTSQFWVSKNYNVGVFYWNQFADESEVKDAEAKIWSYSGFKRMRYRLKDGSYLSFNESKSIGDLAFECFVENFKNYSGSEIRLIGHSLGNQLATVLAWKIHKGIESGILPPNVMPKRLVLLDPFWSKGEKNYIGNRWTGEVSRQYVRELITLRAIAVEMYKGSMIGGLLVGDENEEMKGMVAFYRLWADFIPTNDQAEQHTYAVAWYFWSMESMVNGDNYKFGAAVDNDTVKKMMNWNWTKNKPIEESFRKMWYTEGQGNKTPTPLDDYFKQKSGVSTWENENMSEK